jgi:5-formyltetrahydrofolate cyclo-ligase
MAVPKSPEERRKLIWARVYRDLIQNAVADSRFHFDFLSFTPDFRGSSAAINRVLELACYQNARTLLITSDNSLERLRHQALKDGKKVLVGTYRLRRGFILLDPASMDESKLELAACLDGMERRGMGRSMGIAQLRDEGLKIDMCATGGLVFNEHGVVVYAGQALFEMQWALLQDIKVLGECARVVAVAHACQVVDEAALGFEETRAGHAGEVQCDFVVTPERVLEVAAASKPTAGIDFGAVDADALNSIAVLQELKGIRAMEQIMAAGGFGAEQAQSGTAGGQPPPRAATAEEQTGIDMVARLMRGYRA